MDSSSSTNSVRIVSKRGKAFDYRSGTQHKLHLQDDTFDARYSAFLRCKASVQIARDETFQVDHENLFEAIINDISQVDYAAATNNNNNNNKTYSYNIRTLPIPISIVSTGKSILSYYNIIEVYYEC